VGTLIAEELSNIKSRRVAKAATLRYLLPVDPGRCPGPASGGWCAPLGCDRCHPQGLRTAIKKCRSERKGRQAESTYGCYNTAMPRRLPDTDFRARRTVLTRRDFGYAPKAPPRPSDKIDEATWDSIVTLPDDVAIRTSNHHGGTLRQLDNLWGAWVESSGEVQDCMFPAMLDAGDDFQSATYAALTGFYRLSVSALRSALELTTIASWAQAAGKDAEYRAWRDGKSTLSFGEACDGLITPTQTLREHLRAAVHDSLFDQKTPPGEGGFARRIYDALSDFSHARPRYSDGDMRQSNGPIYVKSVFRHVSWIQFETMGLCFVLLLLARPHAAVSPDVLDLFRDAKRLRSRVTRAAFQALYRPRRAGGEAVSDTVFPPDTVSLSRERR
jgi:hypothetical protein